jgi:hypothetical protein
MGAWSRAPDPARDLSCSQGVMNAGDKAAQHLTLAWKAVYGRQPDPGKGLRRCHQGDGGRDHSGSLPRQPSGEFGRVINDLWGKPSRWAVNLKHPTPDRQVEIVVDMSDLIWKGRPKRPSIWR